MFGGCGGIASLGEGLGEIGHGGSGIGEVDFEFVEILGGGVGRGAMDGLSGIGFELVDGIEVGGKHFFTICGGVPCF